LNVLSKLGHQGLEGRLEPEAFAWDEVRREDDLLDFLVGRPVDIQLSGGPKNCGTVLGPSAAIPSHPA
jgi:hypothetical protein